MMGEHSLLMLVKGCSIIVCPHARPLSTYSIFLYQVSRKAQQKYEEREKRHDDKTLCLGNGIFMIRNGLDLNINAATSAPDKPAMLKFVNIKCKFEC